VNQESIPEASTTKKSKAWVWIVLIITILGAGGYFAYQYYNSGKTDRSKNQTAEVISGPVTISEKILANKFGWLGGGIEDTGEGIIDGGGKWVRSGPPGVFVWDMMQKSKDAKIDFTLSDQVVNNYSKNELGMLVNIWPFADWDQKNLTNAIDCKVSDNDEMLLKNDKKGRGSYLPQYRCNPSDWTAYQKFVTAIVERYDGDGVADMPGLKIPIKYWEVMNEPDLQYGSNAPVGDSDRLTFYKQGPVEYAELLIKTNESIKAGDADANVLISGAAGADDRMLDFYRQVFAVTGAKTAFDIGNVHCISNDRETKDFNVLAYKKMLAEFGLTNPIWVTEAEAMYGTTGDANYLSTKTSTTGAISAGAERIFFTRYDLDDSRTDMSQKGTASTYPSAEKYRELIASFTK